MFKELNYVQINKDNKNQINLLLSMWIPYSREMEINKDDNELQKDLDNNLVKDAMQRVNIQGNRNDMHFELCFEGDELIGFALFAVDLGGIRGILEGGYGYIMEYYIRKECRRKGYATKMFVHIIDIFKNHGSEKIYLTPDSVSGIPFWNEMGFEDSGKIDPDNKMPIFIKCID